MMTLINQALTGKFVQRLSSFLTLLYVICFHGPRCLSIFKGEEKSHHACIIFRKLVYLMAFHLEFLPENSTYPFMEVL